MFRIYSILIYTITFIISLIFSCHAEKALRKNNRTKFILCSIVSVTVPCVLACLRGTSVGTDTISYIGNFVRAKQYTDLESLLQWGKLNNTEIGYNVFVYILVVFNCSTQVYLFAFEMLSVLPVYIVCVKLRNQIPIHIGMAVFFALFYNITYNASRQCIALAFMLLAYCELREKKCILGTSLCILSILLHKSAFIGFAVIICGLFFENIKANYKRQVIIIIILIAVALFPIYFDELFDLLLKWGILHNRNTIYGQIFSFDRNVKGYTGMGLGGYLSIFLRLIFFVLPIIFHLKDNLLWRSKIIRASFIITFVGVILYASMSIAFDTIHVYRITLYAEYFLIFYFPSLYRISNNDVPYKIPLQNIFFYGTLYFYWITTFIFWNAHETNNYFMIGV